MKNEKKKNGADTKMGYCPFEHKAGRVGAGRAGMALGARALGPQALDPRAHRRATRVRRRAA